jgi:hypothetical protein
VASEQENAHQAQDGDDDDNADRGETAKAAPHALVVGEDFILDGHRPFLLSELEAGSDLAQAGSGGQSLRLSLPG